MTNFDKNICSLLKSMHFYVHDIVFVTMNSLCKSLRVRHLIFITGGKVKLSNYYCKSTKHFGELYRNDLSKAFLYA